MASRIPLSPKDLPPQGYRIDIPLPPRPSGLECCRHSGADQGDLVPAKMPTSATYLGQFEWAWSPMNNAIAEFHLSLNRAKSHWILWLGLFNDSDIPWHWERTVWLVATRGEGPRDTVGVHLTMDGFKALKDAWVYDRFHWINRGGTMGVDRIEAIADEVWN